MAVHRELITAGKFDEKFKNTLRDYFNYGFKNARYYAGSGAAKSEQTILEDWDRLNRVLSYYMEWSQDRRQRMFASLDSQEMELNPFHRVYRFCKYNPKYPLYFFHTTAALSDFFYLQDGLFTLNLTMEQEDTLAEDLLEDMKGLKTASLLLYYPKSCFSASGEDRNRTPNNRLDALAALGLLSCTQAVGQKGGRGDRHWKLPEFTLRALLDGGQSLPGFAVHLREALDFYSKSYPLGEIGTFLLDRTGEDQDSPLRLKHACFMQALNDFNLIDLLDAMEQGKWCRIKYRHGTADVDTTLLCYPLEVRVSVTNGREFLLYYEPFHRSYTSLRLEFIDSIELFEHKKVLRVLEETIHRTPQETEADLARARESMAHSWGVSTTDKTAGNAAAPAPLHPVTLSLFWDSEKEYYIANRVRRECREGTVRLLPEENRIEVTVSVTDPTEMRPWVRSFYGRLLSCQGLDTDRFSIEKDVESCLRLMQEDHLPVPENAARPPRREVWSIPEAVSHALGRGIPASAHDGLFHETFSVYYYIIADIITSLGQREKGDTLTEKDLAALMEAAFKKYRLKEGQETKILLPREIKALLREGFLIKTEGGYKPRYLCSRGLDFYRDVVPLTRLELRWLASILRDEKIGLFLSEVEQKRLAALLRENAPDCPPLPMERIRFYDRFHVPPTQPQQEAAVLHTVLQSIARQETLAVTYHPTHGGGMTGEYCPILVEYSQRTHSFQGWFSPCDGGDFCLMNLDRIETAHKTDRSFPWDRLQQELTDFRNARMTPVEVEFYNVRNTAERILAEFSPWKKECTFDPDTGLYRLKVFYPKADETELTVRLMGYGSAIRFVHKEHPICQEILRRLTGEQGLLSRKDEPPRIL